MVTNFLFYFFLIIIVFSAFMLILVQNSIYSALFLVLSFIGATCLLCVLECDFIALIFIIIYVGAIAILFLFVIMMLDIKITRITKDTVKYFPFGSFIGLVFLLELIFVTLNFFKANPYGESFLLNYHINWYDKIDLFTELDAVGQVLYTFFILQFLVAGIILLLAVISTVGLALIKKQKLKSQTIFRQLSRTYASVLLYNKKS